jgi:rare lipoprotein A
VDAEALEFTIVDKGIASFYGSEFEGRPTANGEIFDPYRNDGCAPLAAIWNADSGDELPQWASSVIVRVNDRGPFTGGRVIDLSKAAAREIGMVNSGTAPVVVEVVTETGDEIL